MDINYYFFIIIIIIDIYVLFFLLFETIIFILYNQWIRVLDLLAKLGFYIKKKFEGKRLTFKKSVPKH